MSTPVIEIRDLVHRYGRTEALHGLSLTVDAGRCYGFFGRNGAVKTTTIKCLLNLLRPDAGTVRVFGLDPARDEEEIKSRIAYVPDFVSFYPWMSVAEALEYQAAFRRRWSLEIQAQLLARFRLDPDAPTSGLSKGQRTQLALVGAIAAEPDMLILDEPTSGLDPLVRREFIQTVIGAYQESDPGKRTVFVSTHLITEFEGLIDRFTIVDQGRNILTADADTARSEYRRLLAEFEADVPEAEWMRKTPRLKRRGRILELVVGPEVDPAAEELHRMRPTRIREEALSLEEIFMNAVR